MSADEQRLILQCQAGDADAFRELVQRYQRRVYAVAFGLVRDPDDAMDVAQEAFIKVHRNLSRFKGTSSFYTWMYRIVVNLCIDHLRKAKRQQAAEYDDTRAQNTDLAPTMTANTSHMDPGKALQRRRLREAMNDAMATLSPSHRAVILLREVEGLSYSEMAEALECAKGTVMSRLFHARRNLQRALRARLHDEALPADPGADDNASETGAAMASGAFAPGACADQEG